VFLKRYELTILHDLN